jgi:lipoyl(octanoyl) transferase
MPEKCQVYHLGTVPYQECWRLQERLVSEISREERPPTLLLLEHPNVFTFGRRGDAANILWSAEELERRGIEVVWADRGGDVTYHGPGQLVGYPLLQLNAEEFLGGTGVENPPSAKSLLLKVDTIGYLRKLERTIILALAHFGVSGMQVAGKTGVWVQTEASFPSDPPSKIAAIGVKVNARGISSHGFALNVAPDMSFWNGIVACGLAGFPSISLAQIIDPVPSIQTIEDAVIETFHQVFGYEMVEASGDDLSLFGSRY